MNLAQIVMCDFVFMMFFNSDKPDNDNFDLLVSNVKIRLKWFVDGNWRFQNSSAEQLVLYFQLG